MGLDEKMMRNLPLQLPLLCISIDIDYGLLKCGLTGIHEMLINRGVHGLVQARLKQSKPGPIHLVNQA